MTQSGSLWSEIPVLKAVYRERRDALAQFLLFSGASGSQASMISGFSTISPPLPESGNFRLARFGQG